MVTENEPTRLVAIEPDLLDTTNAGPAAIRGGTLRVVGYLLGVLLSLVSVPLLIRHLGFSEYGRYVTTIALVTIVQGITDVGLGQIGVREYATRSGPDRVRLMRNLMGVRFALTTVGVAFATAFAALAGYGHAVLIGTLLAGIGMVLTVIQGTLAVPLSAQLRLGWITALDLLRQVLSVAAIVILVLAGAKLLPFLAVSIPVSLVVLAATLLVIYGTMPLRPSFHRAEWSALIKAVLPFAAAVVIGTLYLRITVVLMSLLASTLQTGYYGTSFTVISVLIAIPALTVGATLPILARAARDDRERLAYVLQRLVEVTMIVGVGLGLGLALGAEFVVRVLARGHVEPAIVVLQIQSLAIVTQFVGASWQYGLLALHRHRSALIVSATGLVVSVCLTVALVPVLEAKGAAVAFAAAELAVAASSFLLLRAASPDLRFSMRVPSRVVLAALLAGSVALIPGLSSLAAALIAVVIYLAALAVLRAIPDELRHALLARRRASRAIKDGEEAGLSP
ncbi:MAG TPA: oligosaccharide flippase family protein [Solirubrobacteraceae bacterium]|jgi:O-antigen/teichoic acid export membrane protein|nr:oligosaccharide flippase family protein [Solirubrobacteraceae bacterium]